MKAVRDSLHPDSSPRAYTHLVLRTPVRHLALITSDLVRRGATILRLEHRIGHARLEAEAPHCHLAGFEAWIAHHANAEVEVELGNQAARGPSSGTGR